jgi:hypothetical protein
MPRDPQYIPRWVVFLIVFLILIGMYGVWKTFPVIQQLSGGKLCLPLS